MTKKSETDLDELEASADELEAMITKYPEEQILKFFRFNHLTNLALKYMSASFAEMATGLMEGAPRNAERTVALRKLLEGKDAAVRACL